MLELFLSLTMFLVVFTIAGTWLYRRIDNLRDYWTKIEVVALFSFATMVASTVVFLLLLSLSVFFPILGLEVSTNLINTLTLYLFPQFFIMVLYPFVEFLHFAQEGDQATEGFHKVLEGINDFIGDIIRKFKLPRRISGFLLYVIVFGGIVLVTFFILRIFNASSGLFTLFLFVFFLYPALILGYYAGRGAYRSILDLLYLREFKNLGAWLALIGFIISLYGYVALFTNVPFALFIREILFTLLATNISWFQEFQAQILLFVYSISTFILLFTTLISLYFTLKGFREDYLSVTPFIRLFDYIFTAYLFSAVANLIFLTLLNGHASEFGYITSGFQALFSWLLIESENIFITFITNIEELLIVTLIIVSILSVRLGLSSQIERLKTYFKDVLKEIRQLETSEQYEYSQAGIITTWNRLKTLDLARCKLNQMPETISNLKNLQTLHLEKNGLEELPFSLGTLTTLKTLGLYGNRLRSLPESFGKLKNLKDLDLSENYLRFLPDSFGQLSLLVTLNMRKNELVSLTETIGGLQSLQQLEIQDNLLKTLPDSLGNLKTLKTINLERNQINMIPEAFNNLIELEELNLKSNELSFVSEIFSDLKNLKFLDLRYNPLASSREEKRRLKSLIPPECNVEFS
ncbi:MAG: leucine-rich repeat domain-containing protein [Candidatus Hermodarchaeota archaeon]